MLLKCSNSDRKVIISSSKGNGATLARGTGMRMTMSTASTMTPRIHRKGFRTPSKRYPGKALPGKLHSISRIGPGKIPSGKKIIRPNPPPCDNSNDSGFGFDQHVEHHPHPQQMVRTMVPLSRSDYHDDSISTDGSEDLILSSVPKIQARTKRRKIESNPSVINIDDNEDACSNDAFNQKIATTAAAVATITNSSPAVACSAAPTKYYTNGSRNTTRIGHKRPSSQMQSNTFTTSKDGSVILEIIQQPEQQHRARYQTEGSRGAVKDRSGNGFPIVKLRGYKKPTTLQVFIGTDVGRIAPHMFYQACKVAGKNSTPCNEQKLDGTMIIEIDFKPESDMTITCDCVGILKERNVDVEHRFPDHSAQRNKKKSTRCRMIFRTPLHFDDGTTETLQVCSQPIICTQPPGVPEICKKSLTSCPVDGGLELYVIGKNFLKDTVVVFRENDNDIGQLGALWEQTVIPDKEYLQQTHLICVVPAYLQQNITEPVTVQLFIMSSGKRSESHNFLYLPKGTHSTLSASTTLSTLRSTISGPQDVQFTDNQTTIPQSLGLWSSNSIASPMIEPKHEIDSGMMPPPSTTTVPIGVRRPSTNSMLTDQQQQQINLQQIVNGPVVTVAGPVTQNNIGNNLKTEILDENSQNSLGESMQTDPAIDQFAIAAQNPTSILSNSPNFPITKAEDLHIMDIPSILADDNMQGFQNNPVINLNTAAQNAANEMNAMSVAAAAAAAVTAVELAVKQEQIANQMQNNIFDPAIVAQNQQQVNKFLSCFDTNLNVRKKVAAVDIVNPVVNSLFVNADSVLPVDTSNIQSHNLFNSAPPLQSQQQQQQPSQLTHTANELVHLSPNSQQIPTQQSIETAFTSLSTPAAAISQILNGVVDTVAPALLRSSSSSSCSSSSSSSSSPSSNGLSPQIHHDIILNSESAASINSVNMQIMSNSSNSTTSSHSPQQMTAADLILNSTISPSIICPTNRDTLLVNHHHHRHPLHQVAIPNTILNDLQTQSAQSESIINNIIMQQQQQQHSQPKQSNSPVITEQLQQQEEQASAVNANMIIKAAADYISCQEQIRTTESTMNALMSLSSAPIMSTEQQLLNNITPVTGLTTASQTQPNTSSILSTQNQQPQPQTAVLGTQQQQQLIIPFNNPAASNSVPVVNILLNHHDVTRPGDYTQGTQIVQAVSPQQNQESLLAAVSLAAESSGLEKLQLTGGSAVEQIAAIAAAAVAQTTNLTQPPSTVPVSTTTAIPQEITTMSDQDLLSYINPSAFDQV